MRITPLLLISLVSLLGVATLFTLNHRAPLEKKVNLDDCLALKLGQDVDETTQQEFFAVNQCWDQKVSFKFQINIDDVISEQTTKCMQPGETITIPNITSLFQIFGFKSSKC
ncbi:hypothetical protein TTHERM_00016250 (macronuclear) [Tetrahymena thermophila SB210]|uniref:Transmembrane protein n=1 Tax=Tetrahymena thermophila (strain SB210) TaxID=312017 RepID=Q22RG2_TETTS|nr:hypothetical protein TTHERM_00016250 [Tetrahymena thermophila SB210]EAR88160.1 hypothetical protein TTHERM_00016250 [Tetrahymena thermophila SB210]|eukprot:XP_001008405.1 hypothetical protein TTHERM_00016250 [Tetrahymena thermophila SB210]